MDDAKRIKNLEWEAAYYKRRNQENAELAKKRKLENEQLEREVQGMSETWTSPEDENATHSLLKKAGEEIESLKNVIDVLTHQRERWYKRCQFLKIKNKQLKEENNFCALYLSDNAKELRLDVLRPQEEEIEKLKEENKQLKEENEQLRSHRTETNYRYIDKLEEEIEKLKEGVEQISNINLHPANRTNQTWRIQKVIKKVLDQIKEQIEQ